jgi:ElaA protein
MPYRWKISAFDGLSPRELHAILALRQDVFIIEQRCLYPDADAKDLLSHHLFSLADSGGCVACLRIIPPGVSYREVSIGRVATAEHERGTGLGQELMRRGMEEVISIYGNVAVRISAQSYLLNFYRSFGFLPEGSEYLEDGIPHTQMLFEP